MNRKDQVIIIGLIFVLVVLAFNIIETIVQAVDYENRKDSGNERWLQVENRILQTEEKVNTFEEELKKWNK